MGRGEEGWERGMGHKNSFSIYNISGNVLCVRYMCQLVSMKSIVTYIFISLNDKPLFQTEGILLSCCTNVVMLL